MNDAIKCPLFVDLDDTLIATDLLYEGLAGLAARQSRALLKLPFWIIQGRAQFKQQVANEIGVDAEFLPYRDAVINFLKEQRSLGRVVILATASHREYAEPVAKHLNLFDDVLASDGNRNLKAERKCEAIKEYCREHGYSEFAYLGDSRADLAIWKEATECYIVASASPSITRELQKRKPESQIIGQRTSKLRAITKSLRPYQWVKNILLFVPLVVSHQLGDWRLLSLGIAAFVAFSLCASGVYVFNDLVDVRTDRRHPRKRRRPFASGDLSLHYGPLLGMSVVILGFGISALFLNLKFFFVLSLYFVLTTLYSLWLKRKMLIDVFVLAGLYTIRLFAGGIAVGIPVSEWLIAFSVFLFSSLAMLKRYAELLQQFESATPKSEGRRGYEVSDLSLIESMGVCLGYLAVLVLALYIHSPEVQLLYSTSWPLWFICGVLLYWISRVWMMARRGKMTDDPIIFAAKDKMSLFVAAIVGILMLVAKINLTNGL